MAALLSWLIMTPLQATEDCSESPASFDARFSVERNGKFIADSQVSLTRLSDDEWQYRINTRGRKGLASFLKVKSKEEVTFRIADKDRWLPLRYESRFDSRVKDKQNRITMDWGTRQASGRDDKKSWLLPLKETATVSLMINPLLQHQLRTASPQLEFLTIDKGREKLLKFSVISEDEISTQLGRFEAIRIDRVRSGTSPRTTSTWFAPALDFMPVRIDQKNDEKDEHVIMTLVSLQTDESCDHHQVTTGRDQITD